MREGLAFPDLTQPLDAAACCDVAVIGGDVEAVFIAAILTRRGHRVVWYRGDRLNPHPGSGVIRDFAVEPLALPGYLLSLPSLILGNAVRGGLHVAADPEFAAWVLRAIAASRPLAMETIAADRAWLLSMARPAFAALAAAMPFTVASTDVVTLYRHAHAYAAGWAVHDVRRRYGHDFEDVAFQDIAARFPHLSPRYERGMRIADVALVEAPETLLESLKTIIEAEAEVARHWPERILPQDQGVDVVDGGVTRRFDWVVRCEDSGPDTIWPRARGCLSACLPWRERCLAREIERPEDDETEETPNQVLIDGASGAWLEHDRDRIVAAGAQRLGGGVAEDLRYLVAASYSRIWRDLAGRGWH
ncbi:MAG: hypothetical protein JXQ84_06755, partial [Rhodospirillaceae bacterium]|nr:hypothetical protein [Rhodospirillaceae bacterium]